MEKWLCRCKKWKACLGIFFCCLSVKALPYSDCTLKEIINRLQEERKVSFVYDSALNLDRIYTGTSVGSLPLKEALQCLFMSTGITWEVRGEYVLLHAPKHYTVSGYVSLENGEPLINATVMDTVSGIGTLTNAYGFYSLALPSGKREICVSFVGCEMVHCPVDLQQDISFNTSLKQALELEEVVVADLNTSASVTQTGKHSFTPEKLHTEYALFSTPDLVKVLQAQAGVASGVELLSGLYVQGGTNDGNLFLLDGMPLYQVNHVGGLFSAFHVDMIKNTDFYKSGFPARYGGRLSSVTDVRTKDGDMTGFHGTFSIGMLDGRISWEGPLVRNRTSFSIGMRRSWLDLFMLPALSIMNRINNQASEVETNDQKFRYAFHDINAKLTHRFSEHSVWSVSFYSGTDLLKSRVYQQYDFTKYGSYVNHHRTDIDLTWGNIGGALNWRYRFSPALFGDFALVYTRNHSSHVYIADERYTMEQKEDRTYQERKNNSGVDDCGLYAAFEYRPSMRHFVRVGASMMHHAFRPQKTKSLDYASGHTALPSDTLQREASSFCRGVEAAAYLEDEIRLSDRWSVNVGGRYTLFCTGGEVFHSLNPRVAARFRMGEHVSLKASYTEMNQFVRQLSNTYLNLPTDSWIPSTGHVRPMLSRQLTGGLYTDFPAGIKLEVEGYYKKMTGLVEYDGGGSLSPLVTGWEETVRMGEGKAYGVDCSAAYRNRCIQMEANYTLSWSKRKFLDFYPDWYFDKFDNRHRFSMQVRYRFNRRISVYGMWSYSTGNRVTLPTQYVEKPILPGVSPDTDREGGMNWVYEQPNNAVLPAAHRLDVGADFHRITKRGYERIWNVSIYNVYCRMNALTVTVEEKPDGGFMGRAIGVIPVLPSFSYTIKF